MTLQVDYLIQILSRLAAATLPPRLRHVACRPCAAGAVSRRDPVAEQAQEGQVGGGRGDGTGLASRLGRAAGASLGTEELSESLQLVSTSSISLGTKERAADKDAEKGGRAPDKDGARTGDATSATASSAHEKDSDSGGGGGGCEPGAGCLRGGRGARRDGHVGGPGDGRCAPPAAAGVSWCGSRAVAARVAQTAGAGGTLDGGDGVAGLARAVAEVASSRLCAVVGEHGDAGAEYLVASMCAPALGEMSRGGGGAGAPEAGRTAEVDGGRRVRSDEYEAYLAGGYEAGSDEYEADRAGWMLDLMLAGLKHGTAARVRRHLMGACGLKCRQAGSGLRGAEERRVWMSVMEALARSLSRESADLRGQGGRGDEGGGGEGEGEGKTAAAVPRVDGGGDGAAWPPCYAEAGVGGDHAWEETTGGDVGGEETTGGDVGGDGDTEEDEENGGARARARTAEDEEEDADDEEEEEDAGLFDM